jgi:hypothetical protein
MGTMEEFDANFASTPPDPSDFHQLLSLLSPSSASEKNLLSQSKTIQAAQAILPHLNPGDEKRAQILEALASLLYDHYENVNEWNALEQATDYLGELIEDTDDDDMPRSARLSYSYSRCLRNRFMRGRNEEDLENAIEFASQSVERTRRIDGENNISLLASRQGNLWLCLFTKVHQIDECPPHTLNRMMEVAEGVERMLAEHKIGGNLWIEAKSNLALSYQIRWDQRLSFDDLDRSVQLGYEIIDLLPADADPDARVSALSNLAFRLQRAYLCYLADGKLPTRQEISHGEVLLDEALKYITKSMSIQGNRMLSGLENALTFVMYIKNIPKEPGKQLLGRCYEFLKSSIQLLRDISLISSQEDQRDNLTTFYGISRYAAAAALQAGADPYDALHILEEGRGIALSSQFDIQDMEDISSYDKALADRYVKARESFISAITNQDTFPERTEKLNHLRAIRDEIRAVPEFKHFSGVLGKDETVRLAEDGDIVIINVTDLRSDAIIISKGSIRAINLPYLDEDKLSEASWEIQTRLAKETGQDEVFHELHERLSGLLRDLWKHLVKPVLDDLGYRNRPSPPDTWPRVWWIPTGVLSLYPIHAVGLGLHKQANTMNRVISSYAPSLKALSFSRSRQKGTHSKFKQETDKEHSTAQSPATGIIVMHDTPARQPLEFSQHEADVTATFLPNSEILLQPTTQEALQLIMRGLPIVHFSCHGEINFDYPSQSALLMTDWEANPLTVGDLQLLDVKTSQLAFLSACFTANAGVENLQDETTHVAAALQIAGFPNVVGSLWYVGQEAALAVVKRFYKFLSEGKGELSSRSIAESLHFAVLDFAETTRTAANRMRGDPVSWAPFVHFGI